MIPLNLGNPTILRRALEELEDKIVVFATPISPIDVLHPDADLVTAVEKINQLVEGFNAVVTALNTTNTSDRP